MPTDSPITFSIIAAAAENGALGKDNKLLWHLPDDLKFFFETVGESPLIMGRKSYDSPNALLTKGVNVIVTRDSNFQAKRDDHKVVDSIGSAITFSKTLGHSEVFVAGGGMIYKAFEDLIDTVYLTRVHGSFEADTYFPIDLDEKTWKVSESNFHPKDERHAFDFSFLKYTKRV